MFRKKEKEKFDTIFIIITAVIFVPVVDFGVDFVGFDTGLDGSTPATDRERMINQFNAKDNKAVWLFLLSTR